MAGGEEDRWRNRKGTGCMKKFIKKRVPILTWLPKYNTEKMICDAIAGVTVGLTVMPQGLAYATLAGLEPQVNELNFKCRYIYTNYNRTSFRSLDRSLSIYHSNFRQRQCSIKVLL